MYPNYYPSGIMDLKPYPTYPFGLGGKEFMSTNYLDEYYFGARTMYAIMNRFNQVDPLCEEYYSVSPYAYALNNPVRYKDPTGKYVESAWDIFSLVTGVESFVSNVQGGNIVGAIVDGVGIVLDAAAVALPVIPGGAGAAIKGVRAIDKAIDVTKVVDKGSDVVKAGKYIDIPNPKNAGPGKKTTQSQRKKILEANRQQNGGELRSDGDGRRLNPPSKGIKGKNADMNQAEIDHVEPRSKGGSNENYNMQVLSKEENLKKGNR